MHRSPSDFPSPEQIEVKRLFAYFPKSAASPETLFVYAEALSKLRLDGLRRVVTWMGENWTRDSVPPIAAILKQASALGATRSSQGDFKPIVFAEWERGLDFAVDPMPHGHFIREQTLPDGTVHRVMSEDLIGPDGVHRGYPNRMSQLYDAAYARAFPHVRARARLDMAIHGAMDALEQGWGG